MRLLLTGLVITLAINGLTMELLERAFYAPRYTPYHFREPWKTRASTREKIWLRIINISQSLFILFGSATLLYDRLFTTAPTSIARMVVQVFGVLIVYDVLYYALHRFVFHHRKAMRYVHALHHAARTPSARESLYTHPVEIAAGLSLFIVSTWIVGPVHVQAFLVANFIYSQLNIIIHSGIAFPSGPMKLLNLWARKHYGHHGVDMNKNFGSVSPIWDLLFRTSV